MKLLIKFVSIRIYWVLGFILWGRTDKLKNPKKISLFLLVFIGIIFFITETTEIKRCIFYNKQVQSFTKISSLNEINSLNNEESIVYIGRFTCPVCREFVPKLKEVSDENPSKKVYYLDTDRLVNEGIDLVTLKELGVSSVPTVIVLQNDELKFILNGSSISVKQLKKLFY